MSLVGDQSFGPSSLSLGMSPFPEISHLICFFLYYYVASACLHKLFDDRAVDQAVSLLAVATLL
jgi:hypothetical protein